jgi:hypothetical protein
MCKYLQKEPGEALSLRDLRLIYTLTMSRFVTFVFASLFLVVTLALPAGASSFSLKKHLRWVVVATTDNLNKAIGVAQHFSEQRLLIVRTEANTLAVVIGPYRAKSLRELAARYDTLPPLALDTRFSRGDDFVETVWTQKDGDPKNPAPEPKAVKLGKRTTLSSAGMNLKISYTRRNGGKVLKLEGKDVAGNPFALSLDDVSLQAANVVDLGIYKLDPATDNPQILIRSYTGGAHCCMQTWIATRPSGGSDWQIVDAGARDGDGYAIEDVDGDGFHELISIDDRFLYLFDNYASSYAPVVYNRLSGTKIIDASNERAFRDELERDLAYIEFDAKADGLRWKSNGFLAAWVASKIRMGQGEEGWTAMLENFDHANKTGLSECLATDDAGDCITFAENETGFPQKLAEFLQEAGYGPLPTTALTLLR